eukprot:scaffold1900_cov183-Ochromonas_danica.AAC.28
MLGNRIEVTAQIPYLTIRKDLGKAQRELEVKDIEVDLFCEKRHSKTLHWSILVWKEIKEHSYAAIFQTRG